MSVISIETSLNVIDETSTRGHELIRLIQDKIGFLKGGYYGHRPIGADDIQFPCVMVEPTRTTAEMYTTAKFDLHWMFSIYYYILEDNRDALVSQQAEVMEALIKLFSNNALDDIGSGNSNKYKTNPGFWLSSEMRDMQYSSTFAWARNDRAKWARAGLMTIELWDRLLK